MRAAVKIIIIIGLLLLLMTLFMTYNTGVNLDYVIPKRFIRLATILVVGISTAYAALIFQTITNNKILTPSIMGYESVFILFQTLIVFMYGDKTFQVLNHQTNFYLSIACMMLFSFFMYFLLFKKGTKNVYHLLLIGLVLGTLFQTMSQFFQIVIDPNEFSIIEGFMFVSFNKMNTDLLIVAVVIMLATLVTAHSYVKYLDVIALGRDHAINLGLNYNRLLQLYMIIISVLVATATALVGPMMFLGILVTNLTYQLFPAAKHRSMLVICALIACIALVTGQILIEHLFNFSTTVSIVINFIGGFYFIYLMLKSRRKI